MKTCLTIAGSDCSGGAGIQADLKTFAAHKVYGMSVITALTAQNTLGVHDISLVDPAFITKQIEVVFDDIRPDSIKIGMLGNKDVVSCVAQQLEKHQMKNVVLDPVMISTSGDPLLDQQAVRTLIDELIPHTTIITPNVSELIALCEAQNIEVGDTEHIKPKQLEQLSCALFDSLANNNSGNKIAILSKGGHLDSNDSADLLVSSNGQQWFAGERVITNNTHGTGCTLSSAICARLSLGDSLAEACSNAKKYVSSALAKKLDLGKGNGPLKHY